MDDLQPAPKKRGGCFYVFVATAAVVSALLTVYLAGLLFYRGDYLSLWGIEPVVQRVYATPVSQPRNIISKIPPTTTAVGVMPGRYLSFGEKRSQTSLIAIRSVSEGGPWVIEVKPLDRSLPSGPLIHLKLPFMSTEGLETAWKDEDWVRAALLLEKAASDYPEHEIFAAMLANVQARLGKMEEAVKIWDEIDARQGIGWTGEFVRAVVAFDRRAIDVQGATQRASYETGAGDIGDHASATFRLSFLDLLADWRSWENPRPLWMSRLPDFFACSTAPRIARAHLMMAAMAGDERRARDVGLGMLHWRPAGYPESDDIRQSLNDSAFQQSQAAWQDFVFGFRRDAADLKELWMEQEESLDLLGWRDRSEDDILLRASLHVASRFPAVYQPYAVQFEERDLLYRVTRTKQDLTRQGLRILYERRATGKWPALADERTVTELSLHVDPEPRDFFETDGRLHYLAPPSDDAPFTLYSVGPDGVDGGGSMEYDVRKGSTSPGDLILRLIP